MPFDPISYAKAQRAERTLLPPGDAYLHGELASGLTLLPDPWHDVENLSIEAPIITVDDLPEVDGLTRYLVADPFPVRVGDKVYLFVEYATINGAEHIWVGESADGINFTNWQDCGVIGLVNGPSRAAYPRVFFTGRNWYMLVDSPSEGIPLLRTTPEEFPLGWEMVNWLLRPSGNGTDPDANAMKDASLIRHNGMWWLQYLGRPTGSDPFKMCLAYSGELEGPYTKHPSNPVYDGATSLDSAANLSGGGGWWKVGESLYNFCAVNNRRVNILAFDELTTSSVSIRTDVLKGDGAFIGDRRVMPLPRVYNDPAVGGWGHGSHHLYPVWFRDRWFIYYDSDTNGLDTPGAYAIGVATSGAPRPSLPAQNLVRHSENFNSWLKSNATVVSDVATAPDGTQTADEITTTSGPHNVRLAADVEPNKTYTFSFWVKRGTMTDLKLSVRDYTNSADIVKISQYYAQTSDAWSRVSVTFVTPPTCTEVMLYPLRDSLVTGTVYLWGAQLSEGPTPRKYVTTTDTVVP